MRLNQFLDKLAMTPRTWFLVDGQIRMRDPDTQHLHCPISGVAKDMGVQSIHIGELEAPVLANDIGLSEQTAARVMDATDDDPRYPTLRRRLMRKCGLGRRRLRSVHLRD